jgi:Domain of unknown function (DUF4471)
MQALAESTPHEQATSATEDAQNATESSSEDPPKQIHSEANPAATDASEQPMAGNSDAQPEAEQSSTTSSLSAEALQTLGRFKIHLLSGDFAKTFASKRKFAGKFAAATVGSHHVHMLKSEHKLAAVLQPGARVAAESVKHFVQLKPEHVGKFEASAKEWAEEGGLLPDAASGGLPEGHIALHKPAATSECG